MIFIYIKRIYLIIFTYYILIINILCIYIYLFSWHSISLIEIMIYSIPSIFWPDQFIRIELNISIIKSTFRMNDR